MAEKDNKWIEILSGKSKPNPKNKDEVEAAKLRDAIGSYEESIGLNKITPENSYIRFQEFQKANELEKIKKTDNQSYFKLITYVKNRLQAIKLLIVFILGIFASLLLPLISVNAPMQVASNNSSHVNNFEQALKGTKNSLNTIDDLKGVNPRFNALISHKKTTVYDYIELSKIHSVESEDYLNKYIELAFNNFKDYGELLKTQHKQPLLCIAKGNDYEAGKLREFIDSEIKNNNKLNLNQGIETILLIKLVKDNPCN